MEKNSPLHLQEVLFGSQDPKISNQLSKLLKAGMIRKIAPRLYTSNLTEPVESIIRRNIFQILGSLYPGTLLSHRSAFEFQPTKTGQLFLTTSYTKKVKLPGITLQFLEGVAPIYGDHQFVGELFVSQKARAFLENLQPSKKSGSESKCLSLPEIEEKLEQIIRVHGEDEINKLRDLAKSIAEPLNMKKEYEKLNRFISALLSTKTSKILTSPLAKARAFGLPFDPDRITLFETLFRALKSSEFPYREDRNTTSASFRNFAFFEGYFSNYIEGTVFDIDEAKKIIQTNKPLPARNDDSHDVLGTYQIVSNRQEMQITPTTAEEFLKIISFRHSVLLSSRLNKNPGLFKDKNNFSGSTAFVDFNLVKGTLIKSFDYYTALDHPFAKAAYIMFVMSEVHPFLDGNGRTARVMMNAELVKAGQSKIIIPTVFREDYIGALKKFTKQGKCDTYINMLQKAHEFSANVYDENMDDMQDYLTQCKAFTEDSEVILKIIERK
jgi:prophage maintenance system killer protein